MTNSHLPITLRLSAASLDTFAPGHTLTELDYAVLRSAADTMLESADALKSYTDAEQDGALAFLPLGFGQTVYFPDGATGELESCYIGRKGVQRLFLRRSDGEKVTSKPNGIGRDFFLKDPFATVGAIHESPAEQHNA